MASNDAPHLLSPKTVETDITSEHSPKHHKQHKDKKQHKHSPKGSRDSPKSSSRTPSKSPRHKRVQREKHGEKQPDHEATFKVQYLKMEVSKDDMDPHLPKHHATSTTLTMHDHDMECPQCPEPIRYNVLTQIAITNRTDVELSKQMQFTLITNKNRFHFVAESKKERNEIVRRILSHCSIKRANQMILIWIDILSSTNTLVIDVDGMFQLNGHADVSVVKNCKDANLSPSKALQDLLSATDDMFRFTKKIERESRLQLVIEEGKHFEKSEEMRIFEHIKSDLNEQRKRITKDRAKLKRHLNEFEKKKEIAAKDQAEVQQLRSDLEASRLELETYRTELERDKKDIVREKKCIQKLRAEVENTRKDLKAYHEKLQKDAVSFSEGLRELELGQTDKLRAACSGHVSGRSSPISEMIRHPDLYQSGFGTGEHMLCHDSHVQSVSQSQSKSEGISTKMASKIRHSPKQNQSEFEQDRHVLKSDSCKKEVKLSTIRRNVNRSILKCKPKIESKFSKDFWSRVASRLGQTEPEIPQIPNMIRTERSRDLVRALVGDQEDSFADFCKTQRGSISSQSRLEAERDRIMSRYDRARKEKRLCELEAKRDVMELVANGHPSAGHHTVENVDGQQHKNFAPPIRNGWDVHHSKGKPPKSKCVFGPLPASPTLINHRVPQRGKRYRILEPWDSVGGN